MLPSRNKGRHRDPQYSAGKKVEIRQAATIKRYHISSRQAQKFTQARRYQQ